MLRKITESNRYAVICGQWRSFRDTYLKTTPKYHSYCRQKAEALNYLGFASVVGKIHEYRSAMSIFDAYNQEFNSLCQEITKNISELKMAPNSETDKISGLVRQVDGLLSQASELIKQMEVEVRSHDPATRKVLLEKVTQYKKSMLSHRADFER